MEELEGKKILFVIASRDFRDPEYTKPRAVLEGAGAEIKVASSTTEVSVGAEGTRVRPDLLLRDANAGDYDAVVFVGGAGSSEYFADPAAHKLVQEMNRLGKLVSAICIAPNTLARAGILAGRRVTSFPSVKDDLVSSGANYTGSSVEVDGRIITASGPPAAEEFGEKIKKCL